jgi:transposase
VHSAYSIKYTPKERAGLRGFDYEIRDVATGNVIGFGWSAGKQRDAEQDARGIIARREAKAA